MSWLSGIAKGAEALLDKVDQSAASALQIEETKASASVSDQVDQRAYDGSYSSQQKDIPSTSGSKFYDQFVKPVAEAPKAAPVTNSRPISRSASASNVKTGSDAQIFDFLNSATTASDIPSKAKFLTSTPIRSKTPTGRLTTAPVVSKADIPDQVLTNVAAASIPAGVLVAEQKQQNEEIKTIKIKDDIVEHMDAEDGAIPFATSSSQAADRENKGMNDRISNLQLENKLLKSEISSLNEELASSLRRVKEMQGDGRHLEEKLEHAQSQMLHQDKAVRGIQEHERDLNEALRAKDSQLAVLRVRIQEADDNLKSKTDLANRLTTENNRILKDHTDSSGLHGVTLNTIKDKLEERERELQETKKEHSQAQNELMGLQGRLQNEQNQMAESIKSLQLKLNEEKAKFKDVEHSLRLSKDAAETAQRDLKEYKDKATRILQAKEKLITSLKQGTAGTDASSIVFTELEDMRQERDLLREELQQLKYKFEQLKMDLFEIEQQSQSESEEQQNIIENLERLLEDEKHKRLHSEEELAQHLEELQLSKEDFQRQKTKSSTVIQERETEIQRLNHQISYKSSVSPSQEELENRVHSLTDNLIQKQSLIETLSTEKNSLSLQLERLEQQYRDVQNNLTKSTTHLRHNHHMDFEDGDDVNLTSGSIASIMPTPVTRSRRWKSTVNVIDKFSIRLGVFLRRYPVARLFVILYVFILHLWVTIVLLTYQPEIHKKSDSKLPNPSQ